MTSESGSALPLLAALILVALVVVGLASEVGLFAATVREAAFAADVGAEAGAAILSPASAYAGEIRLDPPQAEAVAVDATLTARPRPGRSVTATANPTIVCVTVTQRYEPRLLRTLGVGPRAIAVDSCAVPGRG